MAINNINSITPPFLQKGDLVEIIAPAKFISNEDVDSAIDTIKKAGFNIKTNSNLFDQHNVFAGSIKQRTHNLQKALDSVETKAIFFARGGYGSIQLIDQIDFTLFTKHPKWLIGFSDLTTILMHIYTQYNIKSIHGPMPYNFTKTKQDHVIELFNIITGRESFLELLTHQLNQLGTAEGQLVGGNLSILCSLLGSPSFNTRNKDIILFLEDVDEYFYHIERMMYTLDRSGFLKNLKGLIIGGMTNMLDNEIGFGKDAYELIYDITKKYDYPICFNFPIGHSDQNHPMIIGSNVTMEVTEKSSRIICKR